MRGGCWLQPSRPLADPSREPRAQAKTSRASIASRRSYPLPLIDVAVRRRPRRGPRPSTAAGDPLANPKCFQSSLLSSGERLLIMSGRSHVGMRDFSEARRGLFLSASFPRAARDVHRRHADRRGWRHGSPRGPCRAGAARGTLHAATAGGALRELALHQVPLSSRFHLRGGGSPKRGMQVSAKGFRSIDHEGGSSFRCRIVSARGESAEFAPAVCRAPAKPAGQRGGRRKS